MARQIRVCIIGAGAAGIITARKLAANGIEFIMFEQSSHLGGIWKYEEEIKNPINPVYPSLHTNLPSKLMAPKDTFWTDEIEFPSHHGVYDFLMEISKDLDINTIKLKSKVMNCEKKHNQWIVKVFNEEDGILDYKFDYIVIGNGHFSKPNLPIFKGINNFKGQISHAQTYRHPEAFAGKRVLVVGASFSAQDIIRGIAPVCNHAFVSVREGDRDTTLSKFNLKENIHNVSMRPEVSEIQSDGTVLFQDASKIQVSHIIFATGYLYSFPFLSNEAKITDGNQVFDLYLQMYKKQDPSMVFIGLSRQVVPFYHMEYQAEHFLDVLKGKVILPDISDMDRMDFHMEKPHCFTGISEFEYCDHLANQYEGEKVPEWRKKVRLEVSQLRFEHLGY